MNGWVTEVDQRERRNLWYPVLYYGGSFCTNLEVWFDSAKECKDFIRREVVGTTLMND